MKFHDITLNHVDALDGLRGVAITLVILHHYFSKIIPETNALNAIVASGWIGVDLFFVLSGFLITSILLKSKTLDKSKDYFKNFYARRFLRIFPLYYLFLVLVILIDAMGLGATFGFEKTTYWPFFFYIQNFFLVDFSNGRLLGGSIVHLWSLAIEEQFYLVWPVIVLLFKKKHLLYVGIGAIVIVNAGRWIWALSGGLHTVAYINSFMRVDTLIVGALVALIINIVPWQKKGQQILALAFALSVVYILIELYRYGYLSRHRLGYPTLYLAVSSISAAIILNILRKDSRLLPSILTIKPLVAIGKYSYSIYLFHFPLLALFRVLFGGDLLVNVLMFPVYVIGCFLFSKILWNYFESPILRLKTFFSSNNTISNESTS